MAMITTGVPRIYLNVTNEDLRQVLRWINAMKDCAFANASKDISKVNPPFTTTFRLPLPPYMGIEIESTKENWYDSSIC